MELSRIPLENLLGELVSFFTFSRDEHGNLDYVDPRVAEVLGYRPDQFILRWKETAALNAENESGMNLFLFQNRITGPVTYQIECLNSDASLAWLEICETPQFGDDGKLEAVNGVAIDITQKRLLECQLRLSEERFRGMNQSSPIGIFQIDPDDLYIYVNPAWQKITGVSMKSALGTPWGSLIHPDDQERLFQEWARAESENIDFSVECRIIRPDNSARWVQIDTRFLFDDQGKITFGTLQDISERKQAQIKQERLIQQLVELKNQLEVTARTDPLTGLPNRRFMLENLDAEMVRFQRSGKPFCLALADIDLFKKINDTYGHDAGDYVLVGVAKTLREFCRKQDVIARWGGEEVLLLLPETDLKGGIHLAEKFREAIASETFIFEKQTIQVSLSFGVSVIHENETDIDLCLRRADKALYGAKDAGRNCVIGESSL